MRVDAAEAPWVSTGTETVRVGPAVGTRAGVAAEVGAEPRAGEKAKSRAASATDCEDVKREYEAKIQELQRRIDDCEKLRRCIEDCLKTYPQAALQAPRPYDDSLLGEDPSRAPRGPGALLPASTTTYDLPGATFRELQPASYTAPPPVTREVPRRLCVPSLSEAQRLPAP
jgi:hypothetical protein